MTHEGQVADVLEVELVEDVPDHLEREDVEGAAAQRSGRQRSLPNRHFPA